LEYYSALYVVKRRGYFVPNFSETHNVVSEYDFIPAISYEFVGTFGQLEEKEAN
jgi:hypothetical protein